MTHDQAPARAAEASGHILAPHAPLPGYQTRSESREQFVRALFNRTASSYDRLNTAFSLGTGQRYRHRTLVAAGLKAGDRVLDVAVGTGLVAREAASITGQQRSVIGLDVSEGMLAQAKLGLALSFVQARAEAIPLRDASVDFVSMGYALRHIADLSRVFAEFRRVLKPGGRLVIMEIARPGNRLARMMLKAYLGNIIPLLIRAFGMTHERMLVKYYWDTINACVPPAAILQELTTAGFVEVSCQTEFGIFHAYRGQKE